ncbi:hypothetical protein D3C77_733070 [compost metagenome]
MATLVTSKPLMKPTIQPTPTPATNAPIIPHPDCKANAPANEDNAVTAPTDKSISPVLITKVMAKPINEIVAVWRIILRRLFVVKNPSSNNEIEK